MQSGSQEQPCGVGGWLAFRIVQLTVLNPLWAIFFHSGLRHPVLLFASSLLVLIGFISGILLALEMPIAIRLVAMHLSAWVLYALFIIGRDIHARSTQHVGIVLTLWLLEFAMYFAWFLYFRRSVRVRNTFGRNL